MSHAYVSLKKNVLAVAVRKADSRGSGWFAYIAAAPGRDHDAEAQDVLDSGTLINEKTARAIFDEPPWSELPYDG